MNRKKADIIGVSSFTYTARESGDRALTERVSMGIRIVATRFLFSYDWTPSFVHSKCCFEFLAPPLVYHALPEHFYHDLSISEIN